MKAFGIRKGGGIDMLEELDLPEPELRPRDLLIRVDAVALNPVDFKLRGRDPTNGQHKVLGWDGAGVVETCGAEATGFRVGDRVYFAGAFQRDGSNADFVAIDERIVAHAPASVDATVAASVPLVALTAWEGLEQCGVDPSLAGSGHHQSILVIPGAGGVGSYVIQFAKAAGLQVIATASREESREACLALGADFVINHREPLKPQLEKLGINDVNFIFDAVDLKGYGEQFSQIIQPFGKIASITMLGESLEFLDAFKLKSVSLACEFMFTRPQYEPKHMNHQREILTKVAKMIDNKKLHTPIWKSLSWSLAALREGHQLQESGKAIGKIVMSRV
jgi:zinc-binding alcohol dehydrogenase family protein